VSTEPRWAEDVPKPGTEAGATEETEDSLSKLFKRGGAFFTDVPQTPASVWGSGGEVLWAEGEALMLAAPQGVGKTTLAHQIIRARIGLQDGVLGYPVTPGKRALLLAMDRPAQSRRAGNRIFKKDDAKYIDEHLVVWEGPPPYDLAKRPEILAAMCDAAKADTVIIDSLKDAAIGLSLDEVGAGYNRARQKALAAGIEVLELHHLVKNGPNGAKPNDINGIYGSVWLTSGTGSVILLWGEAGDPVISFRHVKQPMNEVGPFQVIHDQEGGTSEVLHGADLVELVRSGGVHGLTAAKAAETLYEKKNPSAADKEKARRKLDKLVQAGMLTRLEGERGGRAATYFLRRVEAA
jgi:DNA polymerase III delta prime subunit